MPDHENTQSIKPVIRFGPLGRVRSLSLARRQAANLSRAPCRVSPLSGLGLPASSCRIGCSDGRAEKEGRGGHGSHGRGFPPWVRCGDAPSTPSRSVALRSTPGRGHVPEVTACIQLQHDNATARSSRRPSAPLARLRTPPGAGSVRTRRRTAPRADRPAPCANRPAWSGRSGPDNLSVSPSWPRQDVAQKNASALPLS